jgi:hypothetical protein
MFDTGAFYQLHSWRAAKQIPMAAERIFCHKGIASGATVSEVARETAQELHTHLEFGVPPIKLEAL